MLAITIYHLQMVRRLQADTRERLEQRLPAYVRGSARREDVGQATQAKKILRFLSSLPNYQNEVNFVRRCHVGLEKEVSFADKVL